MVHYFLEGKNEVHFPLQKLCIFKSQKKKIKSNIAYDVRYKTLMCHILMLQTIVKHRNEGLYEKVNQLKMFR